MLERTVRKSIVEVEQNHAAVLDLRDPYLQLPSCTRIVREHITEDGVRRSSKPPLVVRHCHQPDEQQPRAMGERSDLLVAPPSFLRAPVAPTPASTRLARLPPLP